MSSLWVAVTILAPPSPAAKCAFSEADMRRAHALVKPERADRRDARVSERDSANATRDCGIICD